MASEIPFGIIPAGLPLITVPSSTPSPTSFLYALPTKKSFSHIVVLLLPSITLPEGTAAALYLASGIDPSSGSPRFKFIGALGPGKESAIFKIGSDAAGAQGELLIGIDVEPEDVVGRSLQELVAGKSASSSISSSSVNQPSTVVLAQRIIQNAFNFLSSFSGSTGPGGVEVVPLKAFEDWWRKFETRVRADPSFLEKRQD